MKVVLAYSGGLDTSIAVRLLQEREADVVTALVGLGQSRREVQEAEDMAERLGVLKHYTIDAREEFVRDFVFPAIRANLQHEECYLTPALARPLIALKTIEIAKREGINTVAHGATERGNDQFIYEYVFRVKAPELNVLTPIRDLGLTRTEEVEYARKHGIPLPSGYQRGQYAVDVNVYGRAICGGAIEDVNVELDENVYELTTSPEKAPDEATVIEIGFQEGCPASINGEKMGGVRLIERVGSIAGEHGVGRGDVMHERILGIKSRSIIEAPAPAVLIPAHRELESIVLTGAELEFKHGVERKLSHLAHDGLCFDPLKEDLFAFVDKTQERVTGSVELKLYKGTVRCITKESPHALYEKETISYEAKSIMPKDVAGWTKLYGMQSKRKI